MPVTRKKITEESTPATATAIPTKKSMDWSKLKPKSYTPFLVILLIVASYLLGMLTTKVEYLQNGYQAPSGQQAAGAQQPGQPAPGQKYDVGMGHFPILGEKNAKVKIVEFADFRCPFCKKWYDDVEAQLKKDYVDTDKAQFAFRHYEFLGPASVVAGNAAECANEQGKFWDMYNYLYKNQPDESDTSMYNTDKLTQVAQTLGMNSDQFRSCLSSNKFQKNVDQDFSDGQKVSVSGTPTFFINGQQLVGAQPYSAFQALIDQELKK